MRRLDARSTCYLALGLFAIPALAVAQEGCKPLTEAHKLPALSTLLDSAGLVANLPAGDASGPSEVLLSVMTGAVPRAFVMDSLAASTTVGAAIPERILASLKPDSRNALPAFRVRVMLGQVTSAFIEPSVLCGPKGKGPPPRLAFTVVTGPPGAQGPRPRPVNPRLKIGVNGEVLQVDLGAGSGLPEADRSLRQALERQRFEPALLDGRPVQVWLRDKQVELVR